MLKYLAYTVLFSSVLIPFRCQQANAIPLTPLLDQMGKGMVERALGINSNPPYPVNTQSGVTTNSYPQNYPSPYPGESTPTPQEQNSYPQQSYPQQPYYPTPNPAQSYPQQPYYPTPNPYPQPIIYNPTFVLPANQSSPPIININNY